MRVCMLGYTFYEGDNRVMRYAESLSGRGDEVEVIALRLPQQPAQINLHGVQVLRIQKRIKNERRKLTYFVRVLSFLLRAMFVLAVRHIRRPYHVIHVHSMPDFLVFAAWLPKLCGTRLILDVHDLSPELYAVKFNGADHSLVFRALCWIERISAAFADHVIVPNHLWQERLIARSVPASRCSVFMNLPDPAIFSRGARKRGEDGKFILLYPGSLQWHQGLDLAIRAFASVQHSGVTTEFHIYGEGQAKQSLIALTHELGVTEKVIFSDAIPLRQIAGIMENADLGIIPKRSDSFGNEAFSTKVLEFMALGVPVIVAGTKVDRYYFNGDVVTFFQAGCVDDLSRSLQELSGDPEQRGRQSTAALDFVNQRFNWERKKKEYLALIDRLASDASRDSVNEPLAENERVEMRR